MVGFDARAVIADRAPPVLLRWVQERLRGRVYTPRAGRVDFGDLGSFSPVALRSANRGRPIGAYADALFVAEAALESVGDTLWIVQGPEADELPSPVGGPSAARHAVWGIAASAEDGSVSLDPEAAELEPGRFETVVILNALAYVDAAPDALALVDRVLRPGGLLLLSVPAVPQVSAPGEPPLQQIYTAAGLRTLLELFWPSSSFEISGRGNLRMGLAVLHGLVVEDLREGDLVHHDADVPVYLVARVRKPDGFTPLDMRGRWVYSTEQFAYDDDTSYRKALAFLDGHGRIEDWGCGTAYARSLVRSSVYVGIDGSESPFADVVTDLGTYRSTTECVLIRHVLEHNWAWRRVFDNALASFTHRMVLVVFTPFSDYTHQIRRNGPIPDLALKKDHLLSHFRDLPFVEETFRSDTEYGQETIFFIERAK